MSDGEILENRGDPANAKPVLVVRGRYRDFALLKTPMLGILSRGTRVATNVYRALAAARGKPVFTFNARYDPPEVQALDGYCYHVAVSTYNRRTGANLPDAVSTFANAKFWSGTTVGTISHEAIACFLGDVGALMDSFARCLPLEVPRVALVDFRNDCLGDTRRVMRRLFQRYRESVDDGAIEEALRYKLFGVRVDTPRELADLSFGESPNPEDLGPSQELIRNVRRAIDEEWRAWDLPPEWAERAQQWCREIRIIASGGFNERKIRRYERQRVPVDMYGVGAALLSNSQVEGSVTDFSSVIARIKVGSSWYDVPKAGRRVNLNPALKPVTLRTATG